MTPKNGQVAYLSANTNRVFLSYEDALKDSKEYIYIFSNRNINEAYKDVYIIFLWLNEK